jgi:hypothetical protein
MPNPNILQRSPLFIQKSLINPIKRIKPFNNMSKNSMFSIQIINLVRQRNEKL